MKKCILILLILMISTFASSEDVTLNYEFLKQVGIDEDAYDRYKYLVNIKGLVEDTIKDDPLLVLGIYAKNDEEKRKYAILYMDREIKRADRVMQFISIYQKVYDEKYGNTPLVDLSSFKKKNSNMNLKSKRLVVFVNINCIKCKKIIKNIEIFLKQGKFLGVDIYFKNTKTNDDINDWALTANIDYEMVVNKVITLNTGNDIAKKLKIIGDITYFIRDGDSLIPLQEKNILDLL